MKSLTAAAVAAGFTFGKPDAGGSIISQAAVRPARKPDLSDFGYYQV
jgi:hypothetical protein